MKIELDTMKNHISSFCLHNSIHSDIDSYPSNDIKSIWRVLFKDVVPKKKASSIVHHFYGLRLHLVDCDYITAEIVYKHAISKGSIQSMCELGCLYEEQLEPIKAGEYFSMAINESLSQDVEPVNQCATFNFASLLLKDKNFEEAIMIYKKRLEKYDCENTTYRLGVVLISAKMHDEAVRCLLSVVAKNGLYKNSAQIELGNMHRALGDTKKARCLYSDVIYDKNVTNEIKNVAIENFVYCCNSFIDQYHFLNTYEDVLHTIELDEYEMYADFLYSDILCPLIDVYNDFPLEPQDVGECEICYEIRSIFKRIQCTHTCCHSCLIKTYSMFNKCHQCMAELIHTDIDLDDVAITRENHVGSNDSEAEVESYDEFVTSQSEFQVADCMNVTINKINQALEQLNEITFDK